MENWNSIVERLPDKDGKYLVRSSPGLVFYCYFYVDKMVWIAFYGHIPCHWWNEVTLLPEFHVTHWLL